MNTRCAYSELDNIETIKVAERAQTGQDGSVQLSVASDDRTGAFDTAAVLADRGGTPVSVRSWPPTKPGPASGPDVVDVNSRHMMPQDAARSVAWLPTTGPLAHMVDSALRGNWAIELAERHLRSGRPVLLVPAHPGVGHTCLDGEVRSHGRPMHQRNDPSDVQRRLHSSTPAEFLAMVGVHYVSAMPCDPAALSRWLSAPHGVAIVDAADQTEIDQIVDLWHEAGAEPILAGPPPVVGSAGRYWGNGQACPPAPTTDRPILTLCGSVHPKTRTQLAHAERMGIAVATVADKITTSLLENSNELILVADIPVGEQSEPYAVASASGLDRAASWLLRRGLVGALVVIGGDTARAIFGGRDAHVVRSLDTGVAWVQLPEYETPIVTRSGSFGSEGAITDMMRSQLRPPGYRFERRTR